MAPTICLSELSVQNNPPPSAYMRRRQRNLNSNGVTKVEQQRLEVKRIVINNPANDRVSSLSPPASPLCEATCPTSSFSPNRDSASNNRNVISANVTCSQNWRSILARREGLLDIVARTMALVRRSHMLQKRVNALRYETREFIRSVLNNPENSGSGKEFKGVNGSGCGYVETTVSSSTEVLSQSLSPIITPPSTPDSSTSSTFDSDSNSNSNSNGLYLCLRESESDPDNSFSNSSSSDYSSDESDCFYTSCTLTQDPMISSS